MDEVRELLMELLRRGKKQPCMGSYSNPKLHHFQEAFIYDLIMAIGANELSFFEQSATGAAAPVIAVIESIVLL